MRQLRSTEPSGGSRRDGSSVWHRAWPNTLNRVSAAPIDFTVAPALFPAERAAVERGAGMTSDEAAQLTANIFLDGRPEATALGRHALDCLAWMIASQRLHLRIAVPTTGSNYHPKIWLFYDGVNRVLARGSGNATYRGVAGGVEHIDVDVSWVPESRGRVTDGVSMLEDWSNGRSVGISEVVELPVALARKIIETAPANPPQPADYRRALEQDHGSRDALGTSLVRHERRLRIPTDLAWTTGPYAHQEQAVKAWEGGEQPEHGVVAMATGAGKTMAALICATRAPASAGLSAAVDCDIRALQTAGHAMAGKK